MSVRVEVADGIATITLDRPEAANALDRAAFTELERHLGLLEAAQDVRCVVLRGAGRVFCSGGDLREIKDLGPRGVQEFLRHVAQPMVRRMLGMATPVVASVEGPVAGAGLALVLAADVAVAGQRADVVPAFVSIGAVPDAGVLPLAVARLGPARARQLFLLTERLPARVAHDWGLYAECTDRCQEITQEVAGRLAGLSPIAVATTKTLIRHATAVGFDAFCDLEASAQALMHTTHEHLDAVAAFLEKRPPRRDQMRGDR